MFFGFQLTCGLMMVFYGYSVMKNPRVWGDQGRRAVAAEDLLRRHALGPAQRRAQGATEGVGVAVGLRQSLPDGLRHPLGQAEGADVRRKIQCIAAKAFAVAHPVTAVDQLFHPKNPRIALPNASASPLAAYII